MVRFIGLLSVGMLSTLADAAAPKMSADDIKKAQDDDYRNAFGLDGSSSDATDDIIGAGKSKSEKRDEEIARMRAADRRRLYLKLRDPAAEIAAKSEEPIDASAGWWKSNGVRVSIAGVCVNNVRIVNRSGPDVSRNAYLIIAVRVDNVTDVKKMEFTGWAIKGKPFATDEHDNKYKPIVFDSAIPERTSHERSLHPGTTWVEHLVFEVPIDKADWLNLSLNAENFGGKGTIRFKIPKSMIRK